MKLGLDAKENEIAAGREGEERAREEETTPIVRRS